MTRSEIQRRTFLALLASAALPLPAKAVVPMHTFKGSGKWFGGRDLQYRWVDAMGTPGVEFV